MIAQKLADLLRIKFEETDFADCFLIEIKDLPTKKVEVYVDSDSGMTFKKCQKLSRYLEQHIDEAGWLGPKYILEVSSPGTSCPLKFARQYARNIGRKLEVTLLEGEARTGTLLQAEEEYIVLEEKVRKKEGKKKKTIITQIEIPFNTIEKAFVKLSFK